MAKPIDLKTLSADERTILKDAIPLLRETDPYYWEKKEFKDAYDNWIQTTNGQYADGGFGQFKLAVAQMRNRMPLTYKHNWENIRKVIRGDIQC